MPVVESRYKAQFPALQHPVAEHVTRHIANPHHTNGFALRVDPKGMEVAPDGEPGPLRRNAECLVVITIASPRSEGVTQPKTRLGADFVGEVRKRGSALVRGHDKVGIFPVPAPYAAWVNDLSVHDVVGQVEKANDESGVGVSGFVPTSGQIAEHKGTLGPSRDDERVLFDLSTG